MQIKKITVSQEQCISTGNFESKRVHFGVEAELSEGDNYNNAYDYLKNIVEEKLKAEYRDAKGTEPQAPLLSFDNDLPLPPKPFDPTNPTLQISCPKCGSPMTLKKGRTGEFWGCSAFKSNSCNGIINLNQVETYLKTGTLTKKWGY